MLFGGGGGGGATKSDTDMAQVPQLTNKLGYKLCNVTPRAVTLHNFIHSLFIVQCCPTCGNIA